MRTSVFVRSSSSGDKMVNIDCCRICLNSRSSRYVLLKVGNKWLNCFEYCFNLKVNPEDLPYRLCFKCTMKVKKFYTFKKKCFSSEPLWQCLRIAKCKIKKNSFDKIDATHYNEQNQKVEHIEYLNYSGSDNYNNYNDITNDSDHLENNKEILDKLKIEMDLSDKCEDKDIVDDRVIKSDGNFTCNRCSRSYNSNRWYMRHLKFCKSDEEFLTSTLRINIKKESNGFPVSFENIEKLPSTAPTYFLCGICPFSSESSEDLNKHLNEHWDNNDLQCLNCEFIAKDQAGLTAHRYKHQETEPSRYLCHICKKKKMSEINLQFHYRRDHLNKPGGLCSQPNCNKVYNNFRLFKKHERMHVHPGYACDYCGKSYKYKHLILEHINKHTNQTLNICHVCGKISKTMRGLKVHIQTVHQDSDPVKCSHCNRMFKGVLHLRRHQRILTMAKAFKCEFCPLEFSLLSQLNVHLKSHSSVRPYCCHVCGSRFKAKCHLVVHIRSHTGEKPYKCDQCEKAFKSGTQLKGHKMSHTKIFPCKCLYCEMTFRNKKLMSKHCASNHKKILESIT